MKRTSHTNTSTQVPRGLEKLHLCLLAGAEMEKARDGKKYKGDRRTITKHETAHDPANAL